MNKRAKKIPEENKISEEKYKKDFSIEPIVSIELIDNGKLKAALSQAWDNRKFEIEMYWKRATYFWTLIASTFLAYFVIQNGAVENNEHKDRFAFIVACTGFLFTFAWFFVNKGSKKWQENWENHVGMLEDSITGPLYKTVLERQKPDIFLGPSNTSVTKTNLIVCSFTLSIWFLLAIISAGFNEVAYHYSLECIDFYKVIATIATLFACYLIVFNANTHKGDNTHNAYQRTAKIEP